MKNANRKCCLFIKLHWLICLCPPRMCSLSSDCRAFGVWPPCISISRLGWNFYNDCQAEVFNIMFLMQKKSFRVCLYLDESYQSKRMWGVLLESYPWIDKMFSGKLLISDVCPKNLAILRASMHIQYMSIILSLSLHIVSLTIPSVPNVSMLPGWLQAANSEIPATATHCFRCLAAYAFAVQGHPGFHVISTVCNIL